MTEIAAVRDKDAPTCVSADTEVHEPHEAYDTKEHYRLIDLFAGAGGMTLGFVSKPDRVFEPVWANDFNEYAAATYNENFGERSLFGDRCIPGDIVDLLDKASTHIPRADIVIGGPPCQGFSLLNKSRCSDPRKQLWRPFLDVVERSGAEVFVMENVPQLLGSPEHEAIIEKATDMGFRLSWGKLCAADYGVPQVRWRAFIVGCRFIDPGLAFPPPKTHFAPDRIDDRGLAGSGLQWRTVRDAISDLPPPQGTDVRDSPAPLDLHFGRSPTSMSMERYRAIPKEGMNRFDLQRLAPDLTPGCWIRKTAGGTDLFGRLWWDRPAFTIRTEFFKPEKGRYLHPEQHRPITHREAARLQSFPDWFRFTGSKIEIAKQIGNAVPPLLSSSIASCTLTLFAVRRELGRHK